MNVYWYFFFICMLINISVSLDAMSLQSYVPLRGAPFSVNRSRMFAAPAGLVGPHTSFPISIPKDNSWQTVNVSPTERYSQKVKDIASTFYKWIH